MNWTKTLRVASVFVVIFIAIIFQGFNYGIDFAGGTLLQIRFDKSVSTTEVRNVLSEFNLSQSTIQNLSGNEFVLLSRISYIVYCLYYSG
ncbi:unnamed protein product [marine sediment metagenome]|uniref:Protein translocase subunit SecF n=1 Tax=marine sediment metagenome TaxID=412755 RepID=X1E305_9ZZZZ